MSKRKLKVFAIYRIDPKLFNPVYVNAHTSLPHAQDEMEAWQRIATRNKSGCGYKIVEMEAVDAKRSSNRP